MVIGTGPANSFALKVEPIAPRRYKATSAGAALKLDHAAVGYLYVEPLAVTDPLPGRLPLNRRARLHQSIPWNGCPTGSLCLSQATMSDCDTS